MLLLGNANLWGNYKRRHSSTGHYNNIITDATEEYYDHKHKNKT